jgi:chemotaxis response regulator CheB
LLARLPVETGMAFVLIMRFEPRRESILPRLLEKANRMPWSEIEDGTRVAPEHVYVMPRNANMTFEGNINTLFILRSFVRRPRLGNSERRPSPA